jgi:hypothetical protein
MYYLWTRKVGRKKTNIIGGFLFDGDIYMDEIMGAEYEKESFVLR